MEWDNIDLTLYFYLFIKSPEDKLEAVADVWSALKSLGLVWVTFLDDERGVNLFWHLNFSGRYSESSMYAMYLRRFAEVSDTLRPFGWVPLDIWTDPLEKNVFLMDLYLETGGNPNQPAYGTSPLHFSLLLIAWYFCYSVDSRDGSKELELYGEEDSVRDQGEGGVRDDEEKSMRDEAEESMRDEAAENEWYEEGKSEEYDKAAGRCIHLLASLISAGADIHSIAALLTISTTIWTTLPLTISTAIGTTLHPSSETSTHLLVGALGYGIDHIWKAALETCGLDASEVFAESDRRMAEHRKLQGAVRTGVDVGPVIERNSSSGLRYRGRREREVVSQVQ